MSRIASVTATLLFVLLPAAFADPCGPDLSSQIDVQLGPMVSSRLHLPHQKVALTNTGPLIKGSVYIVVDNLPAGVSMNKFTWTSTCEPGAFLIRVYMGPNNQFATGEVKSLVLEFANPQDLPFTYNLRIISGVNQPNPKAVPGDYDGDGYADVAMFNPSTAQWTIKYSSNNLVTTTVFGQSNDVFVVGDFDGDLRDDLAVFTPSTGGWKYKRSSDGVVVSKGLGGAGDLPAVGDYDGDGYDDIATYFALYGEFDFWQSTNHQIITRLAKPNGIPVPADYDYDGKTDPATYDPALKQLTILKSSNKHQPFAFSAGALSGLPFASDVDGDGHAEICTYDPNTGKLVVVPLVGNTFYQKLLPANLKPVVGNFSATYNTDIGVYNPSNGNWAIDPDVTNVNSGLSLTFQFGAPNYDIPVTAIPSSLHPPQLLPW